MHWAQRTNTRVQKNFQPIKCRICIIRQIIFFSMLQLPLLFLLLRPQTKFIDNNNAQEIRCFFNVRSMVVWFQLFKFLIASTIHTYRLQRRTLHKPILCMCCIVVGIVRSNAIAQCYRLQVTHTHTHAPLPIATFTFAVYPCFAGQEAHARSDQYHKLFNVGQCALFGHTMVDVVYAFTCFRQRPVDFIIAVSWRGKQRQKESERGICISNLCICIRWINGYIFGRRSNIISVNRMMEFIDNNNYSLRACSLCGLFSSSLSSRLDAQINPVELHYNRHRPLRQ